MTESLAALPLTRPKSRPWDPPAEYATLREQKPLWPFTFPDGHEGWLAVGHEVVREIVADPRFSARQELRHYHAAAIEMPPAEPGELLNMDAPEHTRLRKLLAGKFTVRRMAQLTERIEQIVTEHLDAMEANGPGADLVEAFAKPVPAMVICELLGVPYADRAEFQAWTATLSGVEAPPEEQYAAYGSLVEYIGKLVQSKRANPAEDVFSDLTTSDLSDAELVGLGIFLLSAGLDTTANMIGLGTFALLEHPDQLEILRREPELIGNAVEELMRYLTIVNVVARAAAEDVVIGGEQIKAGQTVALAVQAANRDAARFPNADTLDLRRETTGHLAFGHGAHQCLGQQLARVEMRAAFPALLSRFPGLRLAVPVEEVPMRDGQDIFGVHRLPVTW
ncbi:cytochrome P450 [Nonomuraea typhae]|uniref:cytochrome P450 n=1 Tax=Nonomuraea typhae TaxID=2603600 RepID=UPI0012F961B9|nr:cytochrome P450 [Nonomuraea typhae]